MEPGEIYIADLPEAGPHPVIVVPRGAQSGPLRVSCRLYVFSIRVVVSFPVVFPSKRVSWLAADCVAQCENILSIDKRQLDLSGGPIGGGLTDKTVQRPGDAGVREVGGTGTASARVVTVRQAVLL